MDKLIVIAVLATGCDSSAPTSTAAAEAPAVVKPKAAPRPAPTHAWKQRGGGSVLEMGSGRELAVSVAATFDAGVPRAELVVRSSTGTAASVGLAGRPLSKVVAHERLALPIEYAVGRIALADALTIGREVDLGIELEVALDGHERFSTRVPPLGVQHLARMIFSSAYTGPIRFADERAGAAARDTMIISRVMLSSIGSGTSLADVDLVARVVERIDGAQRCPGFQIEFKRKPSDVTVRDRRTGTEVARRTFQPRCPIGLAYTLDGRGSAYASRDEIEGWLKKLLAGR